jgi:hypothetical protein
MQQTQQVQQPKPVWVNKRIGLLDPNWKYVPAASTNILERFRSMGWVPPSEVKNEKAA